MSVKDKIISLGDGINIDLRPITHIIHKIDAEVVDASIVGGAMGFTIPDKIYLDLNKLEEFYNNKKELIPFIILHEIAHYKRFSNPDLDLKDKTKNISLMTESEYCYMVITEELFADRWASLMYYVIYKNDLPTEIQLELKNKRTIDRLNNSAISTYKELYNYGVEYIDVMINKLVNYVR